MKKVRLPLYSIMLIICLTKEIFIMGSTWNFPLSMVQNISVVLSYIFLFLALCLYFVEVVSIRDYLYYFIFIPIIFILFFIAQRKSMDDLAYCALTILLAKNLNFRSIVKIYFRTVLIGTIILFLLSKLAVSQDVVLNFSYGLGHSFGFNHPNTLGLILLSLLLSWIYLYSNLKVWKVFLVSGIVFLFIWFVSRARTAGIVVFLTPFFYLLYVKLAKKVMLSKIYILSLFFGALFFILSYFLMLKIGSQIWNTSSSFDMRFNYAYYIFLNYGINLWGASIPLVGTIQASQLGLHALILDSSYLRLILLNGIIPTIIVVIFITFLFYRLYKNKKYLLITLATLFLIAGFMEHYLIYAWFNFTLLAAFAKLKK